MDRLLPFRVERRIALAYRRFGPEWPEWVIADELFFDIMDIKIKLQEKMIDNGSFTILKCGLDRLCVYAFMQNEYHPVETYGRASLLYGCYCITASPFPFIPENFHLSQIVPVELQPAT